MRQVTGYSWGTDGAALGVLHPKVELEITRGHARHRVREVRSAAFLIGTAADCDLVLGDPQFSEVHSYLFLSPTQVTVRHLGFGPGLSVAGQDVTWATLQDKDELRIGPYEFRVRIEWPAGQGGASTGPATAPSPAVTPVGESQDVAEQRQSDLRGDHTPMRLSLYVEGEREPAFEGVPSGPAGARSASLATLLGQPERNQAS